MKYIFSLEGAYARINYITSHINATLEYSVFSDIMFNYIQACMRRWYFGFDYNKNMAMLNVGLRKYLTEHDMSMYLDFLDNEFWPIVNNCIIEDITTESVVFITIKSDKSLLIEVRAERTLLEITLDRVCVDIEHKLYSGDYIDPLLKEIYDARAQSPIISD